MSHLLFSKYLFGACQRLSWAVEEDRWMKALLFYWWKSEEKLENREKLSGNVLSAKNKQTKHSKQTKMWWWGMKTILDAVANRRLSGQMMRKRSLGRNHSKFKTLRWECGWCAAQGARRAI